MDAPKPAIEAETDGPKAEGSELDLYKAFWIHGELAPLRPVLFTMFLAVHFGRSHMPGPARMARVGPEDHESPYLVFQSLTCTNNV